MRCAACFDNHLGAELLSKTYDLQAVYEHKPIEHIRLEFTCLHGRTHTHLSYRGSADWPFALRVFRVGSSSIDPDHHTVKPLGERKSPAMSAA
jgi:hypothetical protein